MTREELFTFEAFPSLYWRFQLSWAPSHLPGFGEKQATGISFSGKQLLTGKKPMEVVSVPAVAHCNLAGSLRTYGYAVDEPGPR